MTERWKDISRWEGFYQVSMKGLVRSKSRRIIYPSGGWKDYKSQLLKSRFSTSYAQVCLQQNGYSEYRYVHDLVLETFVGPCPDGMECRHLDGNKENNHLSNLVWGRRQRIDCKKPRDYRRLSKEEISSIIQLIKEGNVSRRKIAAKFGVTPPCITVLARREGIG